MVISVEMTSLHFQVKFREVQSCCLMYQFTLPVVDYFPLGSIILNCKLIFSGNSATGTLYTWVGGRDPKREFCTCLCWYLQMAQSQTSCWSFQDQADGTNLNLKTQTNAGLQL